MGAEEAGKGLITEFLRPSGMSPNTSEVGHTPSTTSGGAEPNLVDLSESLTVVALPALQSDLRPYWGRGVSLKRDRPELVNLFV